MCIRDVVRFDLLDRHGRPIEKPYFVLSLKDPCAPAVLKAFAEEAERQGYDAQEVSEIRETARAARAYSEALEALRALG